MATGAAHDGIGKELHCMQWWSLPSAFNLWSPWTFDFDAFSNHETTANQEHQQPQESGEDQQMNQATDSS
ncbi:hypothetical protein AC249_AIPGENE28590 [Exaiptasia diaphana]|nr:hypothetical protein AC249_AIPGENE28590 [Exaiptasia diaphana]